MIKKPSGDRLFDGKRRVSICSYSQYCTTSATAIVTLVNVMNTTAETMGCFFSATRAECTFQGGAGGIKSVARGEP